MQQNLNANLNVDRITAIYTLEIGCSIPRQADIPKVLFSACAR